MNNVSQRTTIELFVIWDNDLSIWPVAAKHYMAASLSFKVKARFAEGFYAIITGNLWQLTHKLYGYKKSFKVVFRHWYSIFNQDLNI
jgi:hypothetical protein